MVAAVGGRAEALTINDASCTVHSDNVLRFDCAIETDTSANVKLRFCDSDVHGASCTKSRDSKTVTGTSRTTCAAGSTFDLLPSGHVVVTCGPADTIREFDASGTEVWELVLSCPDAFEDHNTNLYRGRPITLQD